MANPRDQYAEEMAEVELLYEQARQHRDWGKKLTKTLDNIKEAGDSLRSLIGPAYNDTQSYRTMASNADRLLQAIQSLQVPMEGKDDEEKVIRGGPDVVGLQTYLQSLRRVEGRYKQLNDNPMRVNQEAQKELSQLLQYGAKKLQDKFDMRLKEDNKPVEPLNYTAKNAPFPQIPGPKVGELRELNAFIASTQPGAGSTLTTMQSYSQIRGHYLAASLQNMATGSTNIPKKKTENELYRPGESTVNIYASAIKGAFMAEWNNVMSIFSREDSSVAFEMTCSKALGDYSRVLKDLNSQIKITINQDCFLAFEIIDITTNLAYDLEKVTGQLKALIKDTYKPLRETATKALPEIVEDVRRRVNGMVMLPPDGAAISYATEVIKRLQNLCVCRDSVGMIMSSLGQGNWMGPDHKPTGKPTIDVLPDTEMLLSSYCTDTLDVLLSNLERKALSIYKARGTVGIFIANNVAVCDRMIRNSDLDAVMKVVQRPGEQSKLDTYRKKGISMYIDVWREPSILLRDVTYTNRGDRGARPPSSGHQDSATIVKALTSKDKDAYKEKFKQFNILFESLCQRHKEMLPNMERDVKQQTSREISSLVEPMYARFWDRYHEVDKGKGKYVRWDKSSLSKQLVEFSG